MTQDPGSGSPMSERMQSLLSRAVEDQLTEQRQLAGTLNEVRSQLTRLSGQLDHLAKRSEGGSDDSLGRGLAGLATDIREAVRVLAERTDGVGRLVQQRGHDLTEIRGAIGELREALDAQRSGLNGVTGGLAALPAFGERIDALQGALGGLHDRLGGLEELAAAVQAVQVRGESVDTGLRDLRQAFSGVAARAAELPSRADIESIAGRQAEAAELVTNRLGRLESALPSLLERLDALDTALTDHGAGLAEIRDRVTEQPAEPAADGGALTGAIDDLRQRLDELHQRAGDTGAYDALTARLDALHEGLLGADGVAARLDRMSAAADSDDDDDEDDDVETVEDVVARAVAGSEARLRAHIDEAVLALAEVLVRRRATRPGIRAEIRAAVATPPPVDVAPDVDEASPDLDEPPADDEDSDESPAAAELPDNGEQSVDQIDTDDDDDEGGAPAPVPSSVREAARGQMPWQTPAAGPPASAPAPETPRKRKPWWRPGE